MLDYKTILDDNYLGPIKCGDSKSFDISPGKHIIYLKVDWCRSNKIDFEVGENELIEFDCGNSMSGWRVLLTIVYITFLKNKYLWLKIKRAA